MNSDVSLTIKDVARRLTVIESQIVEMKEQQEVVLQLLRSQAPEDNGWLQLSESAFDFWDNEEDAIYDEL